MVAVSACGSGFKFLPFVFSMRLNRSLNRQPGHRLGVLLTRRLDGRHWRRPDYLAEVCGLIQRYLRLRKQSAAAEPHLFGRHAARYYQDTLREDGRQQEIEATLVRVYGPPTADEPQRPTIWQERYQIPPDQMQSHRRWFRKKYGSE